MAFLRVWGWKPFALGMALRNVGERRGGACGADRVDHEAHGPFLVRKGVLDPFRARLQDVGQATIKGSMRTLRKGQAAIFNIIHNIRSEARLVERAFGLGACALTKAAQFVSERLESQGRQERKKGGHSAPSRVPSGVGDRAPPRGQTRQTRKHKLAPYGEKDISCVYLLKCTLAWR